MLEAGNCMASFALRYIGIHVDTLSFFVETDYANLSFIASIIL